MALWGICAACRPCRAERSCQQKTPANPDVSTGLQGPLAKRLRSESNRRWRICNPLPSPGNLGRNRGSAGDVPLDVPSLPPTPPSPRCSRHGRACRRRSGQASERWSRRAAEPAGGAVRRMAGTCHTNLRGLVRERARELPAVFLQDTSRPTPMGAASRMARSRRINLAASPSVRGAEIGKRTRIDGGGVSDSRCLDRQPQPPFTRISVGF